MALSTNCRKRFYGNTCRAGVLALSAFLCVAPASAQTYAAWSSQAKIVLNTSATGANVPGEVKGFPVPVNLTATNFDFTKAQPNGADLRFSDAAGAALPYEIESWDAAAQKATVWVRTDVKGNDAAQAVTMYWGNAAAQTESNPKAVFTLEDGWMGVWHMSEPGNTTSGGYKDATPNAANATGVGFAAANTADCRVGKCPEFKYASKRSIGIVGAKNDLFNLTKQMTFSIWVKATSYPTEYMTIFAKGDDSWRVQMYGIYSWGDNNGKYVSEMCVELGGQDACLEHRDTPAELKPNEWHLLTVVQDNPTLKYYIDMTPVTKQYAGTWTSNPVPTVGIGYQSQMNGRYWDGYLDEARVLKTVKDESWIKLNYESQREGSKLLEFKPVTTRLARNAWAHGLRIGRIHRFDTQGRLVASIESSGDAKADLLALRENLLPGIYLDRYMGEDGATVQKTRALIPYSLYEFEAYGN
ncbi:MAG: putative protein of unknown function acetylesterase [Fibrobacteres bacterium]|nr:putative protein of unknown function acetylesterase [Fibrobacterota bacterium]